jgi:HPt (histidine-containing phosphotransfer) domain-containing protein
MTEPDFATNARAVIRRDLPETVGLWERFTVLTEPADPMIRQALYSHLSQSLDEARHLLAVLDWAALARLVHGIKGMGGSVGFPELSAAAAWCETCIQEQNTLNTARWIDAASRWHAALVEHDQ